MTAAAVEDARSGGTPSALILGMVTAIGPLTIDLYLPSLPLIASDLRASEVATQLTLGAMVLGLALGQFLAGSLSDALGRRRVLIGAVALHVATSFLCAAAPTIEVLIAARAVMGIASAGGSVVAIAIVRDAGAGQSMLRTLAALAVVSGIAPLIAPVLGSQLLWLVDWRGIFIVLGGYSVVALIVVSVFVSETLPYAARTRLRGAEYLRGLRELGRDRIFVGLTLVSAGSWSVLFTHLASSPFIMTHHFGLASTQYGLVFVAFSVAYVCGTQLGARLARRLGIRRMITAGLCIQLIGGLVLLAVSPLMETAGLIAVTVSISVAVVGVAMCIPTVQTLALARHGDRAGLAASVLGGFSLGSAAVCMTIVSTAGGASVSMLAAAIIAFALMANIAAGTLVRLPRS